MRQLTHFGAALCLGCTATTHLSDIAYRLPPNGEHLRTWTAGCVRARARWWSAVRERHRVHNPGSSRLVSAPHRADADAGADADADEEEDEDVEEYTRPSAPASAST